VAGWWFSLVTSINKTDCHDITEILLKAALNTINPLPPIGQIICTIFHMIGVSDSLFNAN
jgi:hypothetical protein